MVERYSRVKRNQIMQEWKEHDYKLIEQYHVQKNWPIREMCQILSISRAAYYKWLHRKEKGPNPDEIELIEKIQELAKKKKRLYGCRKMSRKLKDIYGIEVGVKKVYRIMARLNLLSVYRPKKHTWIKSNPGQTAENVLNRDFESTAPNQKWVTDITEIKVPKTNQKLYLSSILDLYDRSVISWKVSTKNDSVLVDETLREALEKNPGGCQLFHSDRGFQYTRPVFCHWLEKMGIQQSMSRVGRCIDNASMEGFQGIVKDILFILHPEIDSIASCIQAVSETIEFYMNEYPQERFHGKTPAVVRAEAFKTDHPAQYPIQPNLKIKKFWKKIEQKKLVMNG